MTRINVGRVILAGLVAGLVANALDFGIGMLMAEDQMAQAQKLGLTEAQVSASMPVWIAVDFVYGLLIVFTYAAIRPRFGPGPKTAMIAGFVLYLAITSVLIGLMAMGMFMQDVFMKGAALSLVSTIVTSLVGGALYKE
jgi:hypothetical protein